MNDGKSLLWIADATGQVEHAFQLEVAFLVRHRGSSLVVQSAKQKAKRGTRWATPTLGCGGTKSVVGNCHRLCFFGVSGRFAVMQFRWPIRRHSEPRQNGEFAAVFQACGVLVSRRNQFYSRQFAIRWVAHSTVNWPLVNCSCKRHCGRTFSPPAT